MHFQLQPVVMLSAEFWKLKSKPATSPAIVESSWVDTEVMGYVPVSGPAVNIGCQVGGNDLSHREFTTTTLQNTISITGKLSLTSVNEVTVVSVAETVP